MIKLDQKCWAESRCKSSPEKCHLHCPAYIQLQRIFEHANIPVYLQYDIKLRSIEKTRPTFLALAEIQKDIIQYVYKGKNLFLWSASKGTGKTSWACKLMKEYFFKIALRNDLSQRGTFISVPKLFQDMRHAFDDDDLKHKIRLLQYRLMTLPLVIFDDLGAQNDSSWVREQFYIIINERYNKGLSTFYTANTPLEELAREDKLGERITDRIKDGCNIFEIKGESWRRGENE